MGVHYGCNWGVYLFRGSDKELVSEMRVVEFGRLASTYLSISSTYLCLGLSLGGVGLFEDTYSYTLSYPPGGPKRRIIGLAGIRCL